LSRFKGIVNGKRFVPPDATAIQYENTHAAFLNYVNNADVSFLFHQNYLGKQKEENSAQ
jgi:hypothetical protein